MQANSAEDQLDSILASFSNLSVTPQPPASTPATPISTRYPEYADDKFRFVRLTSSPTDHRIKLVGTLTSSPQRLPFLSTLLRANNTSPPDLTHLSRTINTHLLNRIETFTRRHSALTPASTPSQIESARNAGDMVILVCREVNYFLEKLDEVEVVGRGKASVICGSREREGRVQRLREIMELGDEEFVNPGPGGEGGGGDVEMGGA